MKLKILSSIIILNLFFNCNAQEKINTKFNEDYSLSRKKFHGKLDSEQLKKIRTLITTEMKVEIDDTKSVLTNFYQYGKNCYEYGLNENDAQTVIDNSINISSRMSKKYDAMDFFVFTEIH